MSGTLSPCDVFAHEGTDEIETCSEMQNDQRGKRGQHSDTMESSTVVHVSFSSYVAVMIHCSGDEDPQVHE